MPKNIARTMVAFARRTALASETQYKGELWKPLSDCSIAIGGMAFFSCVSNVLTLTGSIFMLEVYDRVLPSHSLSTLVALFMMACWLYLAQGMLDMVRSRMLVRTASYLDESISRRIFETIIPQTLKATRRSDSLQACRDLDTVRSFLSGLGPTTIFDLPWIPFYLAIIFVFHPLLGAAATVGAALLIGLTAATEMLSRRPSQTAATLGGARHRLGEDSRRNAEVLSAMGMAKRMSDRWITLNRQYVAETTTISDVAGGLGVVAKIIRMILQSAILALGAYLVIGAEASGGVIIASSILTSRALAPVELAIAHWRGFLAARQSWGRLGTLLETYPAELKSLPLPAPKHGICVESITAAAPGSQRLILQDLSFSLQAGQALGIVGPSGSGKSSLARLLVGAWAPTYGKIRLDGATLDQWSTQRLGCHIGYLPQDVEVFSGTVAQNIARFDPLADPSAVIAAANAAAAHDMIVHLPQGYETDIGERGELLSAGQRQRIALARALYGSPFLIVLDEPNSNLDAEGESALRKAIEGVKARAGIVVIVAHRPQALAAVDLILAINGGRTAAFGPRDQVLANVHRPVIVSDLQKKAS